MKNRDSFTLLKIVRTKRSRRENKSLAGFTLIESLKEN